jgi:hypothetical protein
MNQDQINITGMHSTVASYMDQNQTIWTGNKAFSASVGQLNTNNSVISQKRDAQETATDGEAELKRQAQQDLEEKIIEIADQIYALAVKNNDVGLEAQSHLTLSILDGLDPEQLVEKGGDISALATANLSGLADYGITQTDVTALDTLTGNFGKVKTAPRTAISNRAGQTMTLSGAIRDNQSLLRRQLDKQMTKFKKTNPEFYAGYQTARVIVSRRSHHAGTQPAPAPQPAAQK